MNRPYKETRDNMADIKVEKKGKERAIVINGGLTIEYAAELKNALQQSLKDGERVSLDLSNVTEMDLSGLQILCSAHKTSVNLKKTLEFMQNTCEVFKETVRKSGYKRYTGCIKETEKSCLWIIGA
jgi:anti-anti-sigma factor